jgi:hypothetical protein
MKLMQVSIDSTAHVRNEPSCIQASRIPETFVVNL